jgi:hypothetical protein
VLGRGCLYQGVGGARVARGGSARGKKTVELAEAAQGGNVRERGKAREIQLGTNVRERGLGGVTGLQGVSVYTSPLASWIFTPEHPPFRVHEAFAQAALLPVTPRPPSIPVGVIEPDHVRSLDGLSASMKPEAIIRRWP